ncbi:hypothetical protein ANN_08491 [Periplaneta americana]|uniref:Uncharacterized protein n=1 Tax=Periplaneta americana TaxID=6978 RepID=A0ABQ8T1K4_PERAM|nr:hypothetical protein ANN_08491 [Periplaneta americana]
MSPGSNTESYPAFAHIGLRENPGKNLNQIRKDAPFSIKSFLGHCYPSFDFLAAAHVTAYSTVQVFEAVHLHDDFPVAVDSSALIDIGQTERQHTKEITNISEAEDKRVDKRSKRRTLSTLSLQKYIQSERNSIL